MLAEKLNFYLGIQKYYCSKVLCFSLVLHVNLNPVLQDLPRDKCFWIQLFSKRHKLSQNASQNRSVTHHHVETSITYIILSFLLLKNCGVETSYSGSSSVVFDSVKKKFVQTKKKIINKLFYCRLHTRLRLSGIFVLYSLL